MFPVIIIYGPTAVGKSGLAVEIAKKVNGEIISADSMQIYKYLNIGSAKITKEEMEGVAHHLIDFLDPSDDYSASQFCEDALRIIDNIYAKGKTPIVVGGTGLYINGLINGYKFGDTPKNEDFRVSLDKLSNQEIYDKICEIMPNTEVDKSNRRRLIRTLERLKFGTTTINNKKLKYPYILFAICDDRQKIYDRINNRVDKMLEDGLLNEAKYIFNLNLSENSLCLKAIGYKELFPYIMGKDTLENCKEVLKQKTRHYAKRQFTYMNQFKDLIKIDFCGKEPTVNKIVKIINENKLKEN